MRLTHFHTEANGVTLNTSAGIMQIAFCTPGIAGIRYTLDSEFSGKQSLMVVNRPERQDVQLKVADHSGHLEISTEPA